MNEIFDIEAWQQALIETSTALGAKLIATVPKVVAAAVILSAGWLVARSVQAIARRVLAALGLDRPADRLRLAGTLERAGVDGAPSALAGRLLFWVLMLAFLLSAVETLGLEAVTRTVDRVVAFVPGVIAGSLILALGLVLARFVRNVVSSGAAAARLAEVRRLGAVAGVATTLFAVVLAMEQVGIDTAVLVTAVSALVAALGVTVGVAFALGARPIVTHILAGHYLRQSLPVDGSVEVDGRRGSVERIGPVDTLFRSASEAWSVPNAQLLELIIRR